MANILKNIDTIINQSSKNVVIKDVIQTSDLTTTVDGQTALGWDGSQFTAVSAGGGMTQRTNPDDGFIEFVFPEPAN